MMPSRGDPAPQKSRRMDPLELGPPNKPNRKSEGTFAEVFQNWLARFIGQGIVKL